MGIALPIFVVSGSIGVTGRVQINERDELLIPKKVQLDVECLQRRLFLCDLKIIWLAGLKVQARKGVSH